MFPDDGLEPDNQDDDEDEEDEDDDFDFDGDDTSKRSISPSKLTARQRSKLDGLGEGLMELPGTWDSVRLTLFHLYYHIPTCKPIPAPVTVIYIR